MRKISTTFELAYAANKQTNIQTTRVKTVPRQGRESYSVTDGGAAKYKGLPYWATIIMRR